METAEIDCREAASGIPEHGFDSSRAVFKHCQALARYQMSISVEVRNQYTGTNGKIVVEDERRSREDHRCDANNMRNPDSNVSDDGEASERPKQNSLNLSSFLDHGQEASRM